MAKSTELLVPLQSPSLAKKVKISDPIVIEGRTYKLSYGPWLSQPDLLCCGDQLIGLSFDVAENYLPIVEKLAAFYSSDYFKLIDARTVEHKQIYNSELPLPTNYFLEVKWVDAQPTDSPFASLDTVFWLAQGHTNEPSNFYGLLILDYEGLLSDFELC